MDNEIYSPVIRKMDFYFFVAKIKTYQLLSTCSIHVMKQWNKFRYIFVAGKRMKSDLQVKEENHDYIIFEIILSFSYNN